LQHEFHEIAAPLEEPARTFHGWLTLNRPARMNQHQIADTPPLANALRSIWHAQRAFRDGA
jgi:hypothetical protein